MKVSYLFIAVLFIVSCASGVIYNKYDSKLKFSTINSNYKLTDLNNYGCENIDRSVLMHVLETGTLTTDREIHDHYSTTGCSIKGSMVVNGRPTDFAFDYGGILRFSNGEVLGCGEKCCTKGFTFCSWDKEEQKGF